MLSKKKNLGGRSRGKPTTEHHLENLKIALSRGGARLFESLVAGLVGLLIDTRLTTSDSGFQFGGDAGTAGSQDRHIRIETKRYADTTALSKRELQGEVDDALRRSPELELWILACTRRVDEGLRETLSQKANATGLPILTIDWDDSSGRLPELAALCAVQPALVEHFYGKCAGDAAQGIRDEAQPTIAQIKSELEPWKIGFESLRKAAARRIELIWNNAAESTALFAQNAAGGTASIFIPRKTVLERLDAWWVKRPFGFAVAHGNEGVGKTWSILHWIVGELDRLPIVLAIPSSAIRRLKGASNATFLEFLGDELYELTNTRCREYWGHRVRRLLDRPVENGPAFLVTLDGLNQEPSFEWIRLLQILQGKTFCSSVRVIVSVQTHFLENRLQGLRSASDTATRIGVDPYSNTPGGELDKLLAAHEIPRAQLSSELIGLACIPRLFPLVVRFRQEASLKGDVTVNRLLWAYGRDELGVREGRSFSEVEWTQWLVLQSSSYLKQIDSANANLSQLAKEISYTADELASSVQTSARSVDDNYRRLCEIISGAWMEEVPGRPGFHRPKESTIHLALAAALLARLEEAAANSQNATAALQEWLDPIGSTSASADILSAAISIVVARGSTVCPEVTLPILDSLLQSQNATDGHRSEVAKLAPSLAAPLLNIAENSEGRAKASARSWAIEAIRQIDPTCAKVWDIVVDRLVEWVARVPSPSPEDKIRDKNRNEVLSKHLIEQIGTDRAGVHAVMGVPIRLQYQQADGLRALIPTVLQGKPMRSLARLFAAACVVRHVDRLDTDFWLATRWLVLFNQVDREAVVEMLTSISTAATHVSAEKGIHPDFQQRVAANLLWLAGSETTEAEASTIHDRLLNTLEYERDYLTNPSRSFYPLEYRHVHQVLSDSGLVEATKVERAARYLPSPTLGVPRTFVESLTTAANQLDVALLSTSRSSTIEDHRFDTLLGALGRFAPEALSALVARLLKHLAIRSGEPRHWVGLRAPEHVLLVDKVAADAAATLRLNRPTERKQDEAFVVARLLHLELLFMDARSQLDLLAGLSDVPLLLTLRHVLKPADADTLLEFIEDWGWDNPRALEVLFSSATFHPVRLPDIAVERLTLTALALSQGTLRNVAFIGLASSNAASFGDALLKSGWRFRTTQTVFEHQHGSTAVLAASDRKSLAELTEIVAPWILLRAAFERGSAAEDVKIAAQALDATISGSRHVDIGVLDSDVTIDVSKDIGWLSLRARKNSNENSDQSLLEMFDLDKQQAREREAKENTLAQLERARASGAHLHSILFSASEARTLLESAPAEVNAWLDGMDGTTPDFVRRVNQAPGLFVSLCEALLEVAPIRGIALWRSLTQSLRIKFKGAAGLDYLVHMPFRVESTPAIEQLRDELYEIKRNPTTVDYIETVVCALANGRGDWLESRLRADETSTEDWRRKRAILVRGLSDQVTVEELEWPEGDLNEGWDQVKREAQLWRNRAALCRHWWRRFVTANTPEAAYAAWQVLLTCADRKIWIWIDQDGESFSGTDPLTRKKLLHLQLSHNSLERAISDAERKSGNNATESLMSWKAPNHWLDLSLIDG